MSSEWFTDLFAVFLVYGIPVLMFLLFVLFLVLFLVSKAREKKNPGSFTPGQLKTRKILMIVSAVLAGVTLALYVGFYVLLLIAVANM